MRFEHVDCTDGVLYAPGLIHVLNRLHRLDYDGSEKVAVSAHNFGAHRGFGDVEESVLWEHGCCDGQLLVNEPGAAEGVKEVWSICAKAAMPWALLKASLRVGLTSPLRC